MNGRRFSRIGRGEEGAVWSAFNPAARDGEPGETAIKVHERERNYRLEMQCYERFHANNIDELCGLEVPRLISFDDDLYIFEMTVVEPPRIVDFGKVYLDSPPDYPEDAVLQWRENHQEIWGELWPDVKRVLVALEGIGIHYVDPNRNNIDFG